jgi:membrane protease YdiL (CAAX protease family)
MLAATIVTAREGGRAAVRELYAGLLRWRAPVEAYLVPLVLPGVLLSALLLLLNAAGRQGEVTFFPNAPRIVLAVVISVAEEVGWRGFALPRLQKQMSPVAASGIIGILWMLWHIPMFVGAGVPLSLLVVMSLLFLGGSFLFTWAFNRAGGALPVAVVAHLGTHLNNSHLALPADVLPLVVHAIVYAALGLALLRVHSPPRWQLDGAPRNPLPLRS